MRFCPLTAFYRCAMADFSGKAWLVPNKSGTSGREKDRKDVLFQKI